MNRNIVKMLESRINSPNNATHYFTEYLKLNGFDVVNKNSKKFVKIGLISYDISITSADNEHLECRQSNHEGLISLHEKTGKIYILNANDLNIGSKNREFNSDVFSNSISILPIVGLSPTDKIHQLDENEYKLCYMDIAQNIANELVANIFKKLK